MNKERSLWRRLFVVASLGVLLTLLMIVSSSANVALADGTPPPPVVGTPVPPPPPEGDGSTSSNVFISSVSKVIHRLVFPAETISEALGNIFMTAADANQEAVQYDMDIWTSVLVQVVQAPARGSYSDVARSSLPVAGSLAVALFVLRLAMYHWNRLFGADDSALQVLGDWLTAGVLAVVSGPFLDMIVRLGWFTMAAVLGETASLASRFLGVMTVPAVTTITTNGVVVFLQGLVMIALALGSLLAIAGMIFAFGVAQATLYVLAVLGPSFAVASVIPEMRWLRSMWIKGAVVVAIMPIMAGGIFKAGILASTYLSVNSGVGIVSGMIRIIWMFGAAGMLLTISGMLGKITLGTAGDALGKMWDAAKGIAGTVALVAAGVATGGAAMAGEGAVVATGGGGEVAASSLGTAVTGGGGNLSGAMQSLNNAGAMNTMSNIFNTMGLSGHARVAGGLARSHELDARKHELSSRIDNFGGGRQQGQGNSGPDLGIQGVTDRSAQTILDNFGGSADEFKQVFPVIRDGFQSAGLDIGIVANQAPRDLGSMAKAYSGNPDYYNSTDDMLSTLASDAMASNILRSLQGRSI
ncbi:MAG TPA: hypothetical protein VJ987_12865 [Anaerolineales bacterium]|nr:hypothetical protein [Anaerolineales bacterium]